MSTFLAISAFKGDEKSNSSKTFTGLKFANKLNDDIIEYILEK